MLHRHALAPALLLAACGASPATPVVANTAPEPGGGGAALVVDPRAPLGSLALPAYAARPDEAPFWIAVAPDAAAVVPVDAGAAPPLADGRTYTAVPAGGAAAVELVAGAPTTIGYGCDRTELAVVPLSGPAVPPALLWILPSPLPAGWAPRSLALERAAAARDRVEHRADDVAIALERKDRTHATMRIAVGGAPVHDEAVEAYLMDGAEPIDLDLREGHVPGIPTPEAVFAVRPGGPYVVILDRSGYEGVAFEALLVQDGKARVIEALGLGAYYCAF